MSSSPSRRFENDQPTKRVRHHLTGLEGRRYSPAFGKESATLPDQASFDFSMGVVFRSTFPSPSPPGRKLEKPQPQGTCQAYSKSPRHTPPPFRPPPPVVPS